MPTRVTAPPARTSGSKLSDPTETPRRTATIGVTRAMKDMYVASTVRRSQRYAANVTTDPARARYRMARTPSGHEGTAHASPTARDAVASPTAPVPIPTPLKLKGSIVAPHRFIATVATAAPAADRTIASMGNSFSGPAVA